MYRSLIPDDPLTRKLLAKVLAQMIRPDFERARAGSTDGQVPASDGDRCRTDDGGSATPAQVEDETTDG